MRTLLFVAAFAALNLSTAWAQEPPAPTPPAPAAAPVAPMTAAGLPQGVVLISADSFNAVMTVLKAITDLAPELATPQVNKAFGSMRSCAQNNLQAAPAEQDACPAVTAALAAIGPKTTPAVKPAPAAKKGK